jgi:hypothetical protein
MCYSTSALVVVDVCGCRQGHVVLNQHILPRHLQSLENGTLDLARVLQRQGGARGRVHAQSVTKTYCGKVVGVYSGRWEVKTIQGVTERSTADKSERTHACWSDPYVIMRFWTAFHFIFENDAPGCNRARRR